METRMIVDFSRLFLIRWWSWSYLVKLLLFDWSDGASSVCCKARKQYIEHCFLQLMLHQLGGQPYVCTVWTVNDVFGHCTVLQG